MINVTRNLQHGMITCKKNMLVFALLFTLFSVSLAFSKEIEVPNEIGGFVLGSDVGDYQDIEHSNYLKEVVVTDWHGFRKGIISYGVCDKPDAIVKIRMKYEDSSKRFFDKLLKIYKKKFGNPQRWKGDSFGILHVWKWKFTDKDGRIINLLLQHNLKDTDENIGNSVKMSLPQQDERERLCFIESCDLPINEEHKKRKEQLNKIDWELLIPR